MVKQNVVTFGVASHDGGAVRWTGDMDAKTPESRPRSDASTLSTTHTAFPLPVELNDSSPMARGDAAARLAALRRLAAVPLEPTVAAACPPLPPVTKTVGELGMLGYNARIMASMSLLALPPDPSVTSTDRPCFASVADDDDDVNDGSESVVSVVRLVRLDRCVDDTALRAVADPTPALAAACAFTVVAAARLSTAARRARADSCRAMLAPGGGEGAGRG